MDDIIIWVYIENLSSINETGRTQMTKVKYKTRRSDDGPKRKDPDAPPKVLHKDGVERPWLVKYYFKKGDRRINKAGTPKPFSHIHRLAQGIGEEEIEITIGEGKGKQTLVVTRTELILLDWATSTNPQKQQLFMEYAHGKVPTMNYNANMTTLLHQYSDRLTDAELERIKAGESVVDILFSKLPAISDGPDE